MKNEIECPECKKVRKQQEWRKEHPIPGVMQKIAADQMRLFRKKGINDALFKPISAESHRTNSGNKSTISSKPSSREELHRRLLAMPPSVNNTRKSHSKQSRHVQLQRHGSGDTLVAVGRKDLPVAFYGDHIADKLYTLNTSLGDNK